jgi:tetratricopeptide (TPR) repeat protein
MIRAAHVAWTVAALAVASTLSAQERGPRRPKLARDADTNDAQAYFDVGMSQRRDVWKATDAFYWAHRLQPDTALYLFARYYALLSSQSADWQKNYFSGAEFVLKSKQARQIDSILGEVMLRDPFMHSGHRGGRCVPVGELDRDRDRAAAGYVYFVLECPWNAVMAFSQALEKNPGNLTVRMMRAQASGHVGMYDTTTIDLAIVVDSLRARDDEYLSHTYESKAMLEYVAGMAYLRRGRWTQAREAFGRALTEDLGFGLAHARLAWMSGFTRDTATALAEYDLAVGVRPNDGVLRYEYGVMLQRTGRNADAEVQLTEAIRLEPYWAAPHMTLGAALEAQGKNAEAISAYEGFVSRNPRRNHYVSGDAMRRVEKLRSGS